MRFGDALFEFFGGQRGFVVFDVGVAVAFEVFDGGLVYAFQQEDADFALVERVFAHGGLSFRCLACGGGRVDHGV